MAAVFTYNGSGTVTCTITDAVAGRAYQLDCDDPTVATDTQTASGTTLVLTATGITGLAAGDTFFVTLCRGTAAGVLVSNATTNYTDCCVFAYGATSGYVHPSAVFAYDGTTGLSVTFTVEDAAATYGLGASAAANYNGTFGNVFGGPYSLGSSQTISLTLAGTPAYAGFFAYFHDDRGSISYRDRADRVFAPSVAGAGTSGTAGSLVPLDGRVLIAFDDTPLEPDPVWTRIDDTDHLVSGIDIHRGKQTLADRTDTGTAIVYLNDTTGLFDPNNSSSPYFGKLDGKQIMLQCWNPVDAEWVPQFRGTIDDYGFDINPSTNAAGEPLVATIQVDCVDLFDYLGGYGLTPGLDGDTPPVGAEGVVFYEDTAGTIDDRIIQILTDASVPSSRWVVFTGNVSAAESTYDAGESALSALRDAADAELPQIANNYVDKIGRYVFHGRESRFDPDTVAAGATPGAWNFTRWKLGDGAAVAADATRGQMRVLSYSRARSDIVNLAVCWPTGMAQKDMPAQMYKDDSSIGTYGKHPLPVIGDLQIKDGVTTGNSGTVECQKYAELIVKNQKDPRNRITALQVKAMDPADTRAATTWGVLTGADISDIVNLKVGYPGGVGIGDPTGEDHYVEGVAMRIRPLQPIELGGFDYVELDLEISPAEWSMDTHGVFA